MYTRNYVNIEGLDEMATRKTAPLDGGLLVRKGDAAPAMVRGDKPKLIAITVKLEPDLYAQVKRFGLRTHPATSTQAIMVEALKAYLRAGDGGQP
jgi:hypothetical protein